MRVTWIGGWGVATESLEPLAVEIFPDAQHTFLAPTAECISQVVESGSPPSGCRAPITPTADRKAGADLLIAWSLGAWRTLEAAARGVSLPCKVVLLAPFVAFPSESQFGGRCSRTQVKFLRRWLQRDPLGALADFHQRAGLGAPRPILPYPVNQLLEGLDQLSEDASPALRVFANRGLPAGWQAFVGDSDPLLDGAAVCRSLPGCNLVAGAGHAIAQLLAASQA
jgi:hypothetical protein